MADEKLSLKDAVEKSLSDLEGKEVIDPVDDEVTDDEVTDEVADTITDDDELDEPSLDEAKRLYKALKNPKSAGMVIAALAQEAGILGKEPPKTIKEEIKAKKEIRDILKESLGEEYSFLSDRLGKAIDTIFDQEREERETEKSITTAKELERETSSAMQKLRTTTKGESTKFEAKMVDLSTKILPGPGMTVEEYLNVLYTQASAGSKERAIKGSINDKIRRNANDVNGRLRSAGGGNKESTAIDSNKKYSLRESVALAQAQQLTVKK